MSESTVSSAEVRRALEGVLAASSVPSANAETPWYVGAPRRSAKIVATLGPASSSEDVFRQLVRAGLDVGRLNFSHGSHEQKADLIRMVRSVAQSEGKPICLLADLQGPKIRTGKLVDHKPVLLEAGKTLVITPQPMEGTVEKVSTTFTTLAENLEPGARILLSDGLIELRVTEVQGNGAVVTMVINGGEQGHQSAGHSGQGARADRERRGRS